MGRVLAKAAAFDQRTLGEADVLAWFEAVGHLDYELALDAVVRHYRTSRQRMWPADLVDGVRAIRAERESHRHPVLRAPSRFEADVARDARVKAGIGQVMKAVGLPRPVDVDDVHRRALERARAEHGRGRTPPRRRTRSTEAPDLNAITTAPAWTSDPVRERLSRAALHERGRSCGGPGCRAC
ncbi:hypothetical protein [Catellatospora sp. NPDC049609]|uniref:hypothetical protein n=1 Tax=Catellatospora sp. NPDC049609 TaxID=3155505 RepID=UPI003420DEFC